MKSVKFAAVASVAVLVVSCSSSKSNSTNTNTSTPPAQSSASSSQSAAGPVITIANFAYSGQLTVKPGEKVTVINKDTTDHTLTDKAKHMFDTGDLPSNGGTSTFTAPSAPGTYTFGCSFHAQMSGTLTVKN